MSFTDLSPSPDRVGRVNAWIERDDGRVLMAGLRRGGWTLPGGGIMPGETVGAAAVREAWEEVGAHCEVVGVPFPLDEDWGECVPLRLLSLEPSPEGRPVAWVNPRSLPWADDVQIRQVLAARGETPPHLDVPPPVRVTSDAAARLGFGSSCSLETGRLLRSLAAMRPGGRLLELGSGTGVGAAWLLSGMDGAARLLTVEADPLRAETVWELLAADPRVTVLHGDWMGGLDHAPFDVIFADCAPAKADVERLVDALRVGGTLIMDDFSPPAFLPEALHAGDPLRAALFSHPRLKCVEVEVSRAERVILATRTA